MKFPEEFRVSVHPYESKTGDPFGLFRIPPQRVRGRSLTVLAIAGTEPDTEGWDHVSVSLVAFQNDLPTWYEMDDVKGLFWDDEETVVQFHEPASEHVNIGEVLHLWRNVRDPIRTPPRKFV